MTSLGLLTWEGRGGAEAFTPLATEAGIEMMHRHVLIVAVLVAALAGSDAFACEPIHKLKLFDGSGSTCGPDQLICEDGGTGGDPNENPINCRTCAGGGLCWASDCRSFGGGDKGQYGQFKKDGQGELEALVMRITNVDTGDVTVLVDSIDNPDCPLPTSTTGFGCSALYKVIGIKPDGEGVRAPLCTWDDLDDVNTIARTPKTAKLFLTDVNGKSCKARKKAGDQWWMFYQTCCQPGEDFGDTGDELITELSMILDKDGVCSENPVRQATEPEFIPEVDPEPCL